MLYLTIPETIEGLWLFGFQDYMHLLWRLRVQMLSPKKVWQLGPGLTTAAAHLTDLRNAKGDVLVNGKDLDPHNKQHWPGILKMFNSTVSDALKVRIYGPAKEEHLKGTCELPHSNPSRGCARKGRGGWRAAVHARDGAGGGRLWRKWPRWAPPAAARIRGL